MNDSVTGFEKARSMAPPFNYHLWCRKTEFPIISGLRGAYQLAWEGDGVVRQWIHCPESLFCKAHRAPLWTADINLRRQRSGGVWLNSHTTTHISTHNDTQTHPYGYSLCNSSNRGCRANPAQLPRIVKMTFFRDDLHNTLRRPALRDRCGRKASLPDVAVVLQLTFIIAKHKEGSVWLPGQWHRFTSASSA